MLENHPHSFYRRQKLELKPFHKLQFTQDLAFLRQEMNAGVTFPFFSKCLTCQKMWNFRKYHLSHPKHSHTHTIIYMYMCN